MNYAEVKIPMDLGPSYSVPKLILRAEVHRLVPKLFRAEVTRAEYRLLRGMKGMIQKHRRVKSMLVTEIGDQVCW